MNVRLVSAITWIVCTTAMATSRAAATEPLVNLELRADPQVVDIGSVVEIGLFAVPDDGTEHTFSGLDVLLTWG